VDPHLRPSFHIRRLAVKTLVTVLLAAVVLVGLCSVGAAADSGSKDEATALVKKAIDFYKANGRDKAFAEINNRKGQFVDRDLYVVVYDIDGKCLAHGSNAKLIGQDLIAAKDVDGKEYVKERVEMMKKGASGWQDYKFRNPTSNQIEPKSMYIEKHENLIFGCGVYSK
jgi:signal transduction histidine kinase